MAVHAAAGVAAALTAASNVEGYATKILRLERGCPEGTYGTCSLNDADVVIVVEQGIGKCFLYPYISRQDADRYFNSFTWRFWSRIEFAWKQGIAGAELRKGGIGMPFNTIRRAARMPSVWGKTFVQSGKIGFTSYHFLADRTAYISYTDERCSGWTLDDESPLPSNKFFENVHYDVEARVFKGTISWSPSSFCGDERWEYEMQFDSEFSRIIDGQVHHYTPGLTDRSPKQTLRYDWERDPNKGGVLRYHQWEDGAHECEDRCLWKDEEIDIESNLTTPRPPRQKSDKVSGQTDVWCEKL